MALCRVRACELRLRGPFKKVAMWCELPTPGSLTPTGQARLKNPKKQKTKYKGARYHHTVNLVLFFFWKPKPLEALLTPFEMSSPACTITLKALDKIDFFFMEPSFS